MSACRYTAHITSSAQFDCSLPTISFWVWSSFLFLPSSFPQQQKDIIAHNRCSLDLVPHASPFVGFPTHTSRGCRHVDIVHVRPKPVPMDLGYIPWTPKGGKGKDGQAKKGDKGKGGKDG
eukprot:3004135-Amphidinium_carterae.2